VPFAAGTGHERLVSVMGTLARTLRSHPVSIAAVSAALLIIMAIPFFSMRLGSADAGSDPAGTTTRTAYDLLAKGFGPVQRPARVGCTGQRSRQYAAFRTVAAAVARPKMSSVSRRRDLSQQRRARGSGGCRGVPERLPPGCIDGRVAYSAARSGRPCDQYRRRAGAGRRPDRNRRGLRRVISNKLPLFIVSCC